MEPERPLTPDRAITPDEEEPESEAMKAAAASAEAFASLPASLMPEGMDSEDARRRLILSTVEGVALAAYAEQNEPESEDDPFTRTMTEAGVVLSNDAAHHLFESIDSDGTIHFPAMVIALLSGQPISGPGPLAPDNDTEAALQRVNSLQVHSYP